MNSEKYDLEGNYIARIAGKPLEDKINDACHRIEDLYNETEGKCYVSFSGGKDSTVLLALIKLCEEVYTIPEGGIPAVFSNTGIELGVTVDFVNWVKENYYSNVVIIRPEVSFDWVLKNKGKPSKSKLKSEMIHRYQTGHRTEALLRNLIDGKTSRGKDTWKLRLSDKDMHMLSDDFPIKVSSLCCQYLKKTPFKKYAIDNEIKGNISGIRLGEGGARELNARMRLNNGNGKLCTLVSKKGFISKYPIIDWTDEDIERFIKSHHVPLSDAYIKYGFTRTGCMACPYSQNVSVNLEYLFKKEPNRYKASMHWLKDVYIAQNVVLPFDEDYEKERRKTWRELYEPMRQEMLRKYRPNSKLIKETEQISLFD